MADFAGQNDLNGLSDQMESGDRAEAVGSNDFTFSAPPGTVTVGVVEAEPSPGLRVGNTRVITPRISLASVDDRHGIGEDFYEKMHLVPRAITLGNVLSTIEIEVDLYNADRKRAHTVSALSNTAGDGVSFTDLPALPFELGSQQSQELTLQISTDGPSSIGGSIGFTTTLNDTATEITGQRVVVFPYRPEAPLIEELEFLTDVLLHLDGTEQRVQLRSSPRQSFQLKLVREEETEGIRLESILFDRRGSSFGVPVWIEPTRLDQAVEAGDTVVSVRSTANADYRVGGLAILYASETDFEVFEVSAVSASTLTAASPLNSAFPADTVEVFPVRICFTTEGNRGRRNPVGLRELDVTMRVSENSVDLADASAFSELDGKVFLDDPNAVDRQLSEEFRSRIEVFDSQTGIFSQTRVWGPDKRLHQKGFVSHSRSELWEIRRLLHFLSGRLVSFRIPTFYRELVVTDDVLSGTTDLQIENVGATLFLKGQAAAVRAPRNKLRIELSDGTILFRTIQDAAEDSTELETLTLTETWPSNISATNFVRVDFVETVRIDTDRIRLRHEDANGNARVSFPVRTVFGES